MSRALFLDDLREPPPGDWIVVRSSAEAIAWCEAHGAPDHISFDHDLGGDDTGMRLAHWLVNRDLDANEVHQTWLPVHFTYTIHSANPVGRINLDSLLQSYLRARQPEPPKARRPTQSVQA